MSIFKMEVKDQFKSERNGGNYGAGTKEVQDKNYQTKKEVSTIDRMHSGSRVRAVQHHEGVPPLDLVLAPIVSEMTL
jgi:hypothetical protein